MTDPRISILERLPSAPEEYDPDFFNRLIGLIDQQSTYLNGRRRLLGTKVNISDLPTTSTGLRSGDIWSDSGTLKVIP